MASLAPPVEPRGTQRSRILKLLIEARGDWVPLPDVLALGIAQYNARLHELRRLGFQIENQRQGERSAFRLVPGPKSSTQPRPRVIQESLFGELAPIGGYPD